MSGNRHRRPSTSPFGYSLGPGDCFRRLFNKRIDNPADEVEPSEEKAMKLRTSIMPKRDRKTDGESTENECRKSNKHEQFRQISRVNPKVSKFPPVDNKVLPRPETRSHQAVRTRK
jgi:hypothetical protein